jgi:hypothetical protein
VRAIVSDWVMVSVATPQSYVLSRDVVMDISGLLGVAYRVSPALARRRAIWLTRLFDSSVVWREPGDSRARLIVIENSEVVLSGAVDAHATPPIPPGYRPPVAARREALHPRLLRSPTGIDYGA